MKYDLILSALTLSIQFLHLDFHDFSHSYFLQGACARSSLGYHRPRHTDRSRSSMDTSSPGGQGVVRLPLVVGM
jgi:hypothetical protein